ncbi:MAG: TonB-dependent receptor [Tsuneonella suprasediminis]|nr:TonB-dependent receptor [Altererythrobacter sp. N1]
MKPSIYLASSAFALALSAAPAMAQDAASTDADTTASSGDEIVVVGTAGAGMRRQDAAFAVTSLDADAIAEAAPASTADVLKLVPGVAVESSGGQNGANIFVRGYPSGGDAAFVTFQSSGVPIFPPPTLSFLENSQLIRIDNTVARVEAVRGGTGSLFSNGQPGLTVNLVQREGGQYFEGMLEGSITDYGQYRADGYVSGPIDENTTFMAGGFYRQGTGVRDPQFDAEKGGQFTVNLRHDFSNDSSMLLYARYLNDRGQWLLPIPVTQNGDEISEFAGFDAHTGTLASNDVRYTTLNNGDDVDLARGRGAKVFNVGANFDVGVTDNLRLRDRMSYMGGTTFTVGLVPSGPPTTLQAYADNLYLAGVSGATAAPGASFTYVDDGSTVAGTQQVMQAGIWTVDKRIDSFVNDFAAEFEMGPNKLTAGVYYADYYARDNWNLGNGMVLTAENNARRIDINYADGTVGTRDGFMQGSTYFLNAAYGGQDIALYATDELQITDQLRIDGGVRWQRHTVDGYVRQPVSVDLDGNANTLYDNNESTFGPTQTPISYRDDAWSFTGGANFEIMPGIGIFARYSQGKSFPQFDNLREGVTDIATVKTVEGGLKVSGPMIRFYATGFHNDFTGLSSVQLVGTTPTVASGGAEATGVEVDGSVGPFYGFSLGFAGTYLDATYQDFFTGNGTIDNTGNRVQRQPKWQWRVTPSYELEVGGFRPTVYATVQYYGDRFSDPENQQLLPSFYQLDAGISVDVMERLNLRVTGTNLTNEIGLTEGNPRIIGSQGSGTILARPILGRSFTFSAAYKF